MARFDVYKAPRGDGFIVDVQSDYFEITSTRVAMPLVRVTSKTPATSRLNPVFDIGEAPHMLQPLLIAAVPVAALKTPVMSLKDEGHRITEALDFMHQGF